MLGKDVLKQQFINSRKRERAFQITVVIRILNVIMLNLLIISLRNNIHSMYQLTVKFHHGSKTSAIIFLLYVTLETTLSIDWLVHGIISLITLYFISFVMKFWIHEIWYVYF